MWDPQLRPLRPGASLAGTFTHLSMTVFVGRSVKDRPAAPCLSKKHKTEHLTTFFALSRQGLTHTISLQGRSFFIDIEGMVLLWYIDERLDVPKNKLQYVWHVQSHSGHSHASQRNCTTAASLEQCQNRGKYTWWWERDDYAIPTLTNSVNKSWTGSEFAIVLLEGYTWFAWTLAPRQNPENGYLPPIRVEQAVRKNPNAKRIELHYVLCSIVTLIKPCCLHIANSEKSCVPQIERTMPLTMLLQQPRQLFQKGLG